MRFRFSLIGSAQAHLVEVAARDLAELASLMGAARFLPGEVIDVDGHEEGCGVLIPIGRIQFVTEA